MTEKEIYDAARVAVRETKEPEAFLHLGTLYAKGIGIRANHVLANYFYDKAASMGCEEAYRYIALEQEHGYRSLATDMEKAKDASGAIAPTDLKRFRATLDKARDNICYGLLASVRQYLPLLYPEYNVEKAMDDVLNDRKTLDADIFYSLCTSDNKSEVDIESQLFFLEHLFAPVLQDHDLLERLKECDNQDIIGKEVSHLLQAIVNYTSSYYQICADRGIERKDMLTIKDFDVLPYIDIHVLSLLRQQAVRCLLSIKDVNPIISKKYLNHLDNNEKLLNISELIMDNDILLFLISYVEINLNIEAIESKYLNMLSSYRRNIMAPTILYYYEFLYRMSKSGIEHNLPRYTSTTLPPIDLLEQEQHRSSKKQ